MRIKHVVRSPADESGEDLPGAAVLDRGDAPVIDGLLKDEPKVEEGKTQEVKHDEVARDPDTGKFIPKARYDEQVGKERLARETAERRYAELEAKMGQVSRSEDVAKLEESVTTMEKMHSKLLLDGDHEKAAEVMRDIRLTERKIALQESQDRMVQTAQQTREEIKMDMAIERLESGYSPLNPASEEYNQELVEEVLGWQSVYMERYRLSPSAALTKAADKVMSTQAAPTAAEPAKGLSAGKQGDVGRKQDQVGKNLAAASAQPANTRGVGQDSDKAGLSGKIDVNTLTQEDFAALPESMRAQLRGDLG